MIHKLADALGTDEDEELLLVKKIPQKIKTRVLQQPKTFLKLADLDNRTLEKLLQSLEGS